MSIMGTRVLRTEDPRLLTGGGVHTDDLRLPELTGYHNIVRAVLAAARDGQQRDAEARYQQAGGLAGEPA